MVAVNVYVILCTPLPPLSLSLTPAFFLCSHCPLPPLTYAHYQMKELVAEWEKLEGGAVPTRFLRSEQAAAAEAAATGGGGGGGGDEGGDDGDAGGVMQAAPVEIDPYDLADPVDMLGKMPKNFYEQLVCVSVIFYACKPNSYMCDYTFKCKLHCGRFLKLATI